MEAEAPASTIYRVEAWGEGYFDVNAKGHMCARDLASGVCMDLMAVVQEAIEEGMEVPMVVRFHDILRHRIVSLNKTFARVIEDCEYGGIYQGVYPIKVNQMREVVEEIIDAAKGTHYGIEAGSKAELLAALAYQHNPEALTICNGFKDREFLNLAALGHRMGHQMVVVVESLAELERIFEETEEPFGIGIRVKISARGLGKWASSSGEQAKFGLTLGDVVNTLHIIKGKDALSRLKLLHFHLGSQVGDIASFRDAINEATRVYCEMVRLGASHLTHLDVGGGLAIDYDGTRSTSPSSCNYSLEEYAMNLVTLVKDTCDEAGVAHPNLVTESGRFVSAHHSCIVTEVLDVISPALRLAHHQPPVLIESIGYDRMRGAIEMVESGDIQTAFHTLKAEKEAVVIGFRSGSVGLEELTQVEELYWFGLEEIRRRLGPEAPEELEEVELLCTRQYLCNFSVFQSAADSWAIGQVLPIVPIHRLDEEPTVPGVLADITCDSDGKIDAFMEMDCPAGQLPLHHKKEGEPYYLGVFLTGAYQDVMGDMHNLFGRLHEVHVYSEPDNPKGFYIEESIQGSSKSKVLSTMQYDDGVMCDKVMGRLQGRVHQKQLTHRAAKEMMREYQRSLKSYTYLENDRCPR